MEIIIIYGFGSFFGENQGEARDIDVLLLHENISDVSARVAIDCKILLRKFVPNVHIVILSKKEENEFDFIEKSHAKLISEVRTCCLEKDTELAAKTISLMF